MLVEPEASVGWYGERSDVLHKETHMPSKSTEQQAIAEHLAALARERNLAIDPAQLAEAAESHAQLADAIATLRDLKLEFLPPYIEPASALRWIESGGPSQ